MGDFDKNAFLPFSTGSRACEFPLKLTTTNHKLTATPGINAGLGRHFSEVESVCMLAHLIADYSFHIPRLEGETDEMCKERVYRARPAITLTPLSIPITFRRRPKRV